MPSDFIIKQNEAGHDDIAKHFSACDAEFYVALTQRVELVSYISKLLEKSFRYEAWQGDALVGLLAVYYNDGADQFDYITNMSVVSKYLGRGIASRLLKECIETARARGHREIRLGVATGNTAAMALYKKYGFVQQAQETTPGYVGLRLVF